MDGSVKSKVLGHLDTEDNLNIFEKKYISKTFLWSGKNSIKDFQFKSKIKGKIGTFSFKEKKVIQELDIYKVENNKFTKF